MSQLSEYRRKVLKKSQEALSKELGYDKWQTYAAQERGDNPLPEAMKTKLRGKKYDYQGAWPDEETQAPVAGAYATASDLAELRGAVKAHVEQWEKGQEKVLERLEAALRRIEKLERGDG
jgi:DNA-binding XRE family transcriptional regulator